MATNYNKTEIKFAKELWALFEKYGLVLPGNDDFYQLMTDYRAKGEPIRLDVEEVWEMKKLGILDVDKNIVL